MRITPCSPAVGATVTDIDLSAPISDDTMERLMEAFHEHGVLVFRDQHLAPAAQMAFASRWGRHWWYPIWRHTLCPRHRRSCASPTPARPPV